jgi:hypothetical protein
MIKTITMKTAITTIATLLLMTTTAVAKQSCTVKTDTSGNQIKQGKCDLLKGVTGSTGPQGVQGIQGKQGSPGKDGVNGTNGKDGVNGTNGKGGVSGTNGKDGVSGLDGKDGVNGTNGKDGTNGTNGKDGVNGTNGKDGTNGLDGSTGPRGLDGQAGVTPLGSLSFSAAASSFHGDGIGFGLSYSNYGNLEGSVVIGLDLTPDWRLVGGITSDFDNKTAVSVGLGFSF